MELLVHPDRLASGGERARHAVFIATRLGLTLAAVATLSVGFAMGHVPAPWEAVALAWATVPLAAAILLSRTGRIGSAEMLGPAAWAGLAATAWTAGGLSACAAGALLAVGLVEATASTTSGPARPGAAAACLGATVLAGAAVLHLEPGAAASRCDWVFLLPGLVYGALITWTTAVLRDRERSRAGEVERRRRIAADLSGDLVLRCNRSGSVLDAEGGAGWRPTLPIRDLMGRGAFERVHVADRPAFLKAFGDAVATDAAVTALVRLRTSAADADGPSRRDPVFVWVELRARRCEDRTAAGRDADVVAVLRDASLRVRQEADAADARRESDRASAWKDAFIANVSHELRTPLNAIIGFSEILANPAIAPRDPAKQGEYAGIVVTSGHHLLSVVNSLLDLSKIEAGRFELTPDPFDVPGLIQGCCDMVGLQAERGGVALRHARGGPGIEVVGDARACRQIVLNLLSNALKFTESGGRVSVGARTQGGTVVITVEDTGIGIPAADLRRVGDAFFQGRAGHDRLAGGTGLGLSVVRGLVGLHGGRIAIESAVGEGTRVQVHLPLDCRGDRGSGTAVPIDIAQRPGRGGFPPSAGQVRMQRLA